MKLMERIREGQLGFIMGKQGLENVVAPVKIESNGVEGQHFA